MSFYRFPLALLALSPDDPKETLNAIVDWCLLNVGRSTGGREVTKAEAVKYGKEKSYTFNNHNADHVAVLRGAKILGVTGGHAPNIVAVADKADAFLASISASRVFANVKGEWLWRAIYTARGNPEDGELSFRHFRVLCGILSKVGNKKFAKCGWKEIVARSMGFAGKQDLRKSPDEWERRDPLKLTQDQVRSDIARLERDGFFLRLVYRKGTHGGESFFSFSASREELATLVATNKRKRLQANDGNRASDAELLRKAFEKLKQNPEPIPN